MTRDLSIDQILSEALATAPQRRGEFLEMACGSDAALRAKVLDLIAALERNPGFLDSPTVVGVASLNSHEFPTLHSARETDSFAMPASGTFVGPYRLIERIGEGGFGEVWLAEQREPRRKVAVKIIKSGMDSREVLARFEAERQALALMDHPSVAKVFDAGQTDAQSPIGAGRPYFVMEHAAGLPITDYCDTGRLRIRQRLELFVPICQAVQHAHTKGIIHRDLKPSNILVTLVDGKPVPKVIDFGIAKATSAPLTERTLHTEVGRLMGTPEYMSPEQAGTGGIDVDTRSDVYSLGVILYQLLTGTLPLEPQTLRNADYSSLVKIIREMEPPRPSTRLSTLGSEAVNQHGGATPQEIAARRDADFAALQRQVRGELDWIVMKCLEKDRTRRYETANGLAADVTRYLGGEPVVAAPPSRMYRLSKMWRRHRAVAAIVAGFVLLTVVGLVATTAQWQQAASARARAGTFSSFLKELLTAADPARTRGAKLTVREALEQAAKRVDNGELAAQPLVEGEIRATIGETYFALGLLRQAQAHWLVAEALLARGLGEDHPEVLRTRSRLARAYNWEGDDKRAIALARPTLERQRRLLGEDNLETLRTLSILGAGLNRQGETDEAERCLRLALAGQERTLGKEHEDTIETMLYLTALTSTISTEGVSVAHEALDNTTRLLGPDHPHATMAMLLLGMAYRDCRRFAEAEQWQRRALESVVRVLGDDHPHSAASRAELAETLGSLGKHADAEQFARQAVEIATRTYGPGKWWTVRFQKSLGNALMNSKRYPEAAEVLAEAVEQARLTLGNEDRETWNILGAYARALWGLDRMDEALACAAEAFETSRRIDGAARGPTLSYGRTYAAVLWRLERQDESLGIIRQNIEACRNAFGSHDPKTIRELRFCAEFLNGRNRRAEAEALAREAAEGFRRMDPKYRPIVGNAVYTLATIVNLLGPPEEALNLALEAASGPSPDADKLNFAGRLLLETPIESRRDPPRGIELVIRAARCPDATAQHLNFAAWQLLTMPEAQLRDPTLALEFALRGNELSAYAAAPLLDTLALAYHRTGQTEKAIEVQAKALALLPAHAPDRAGYEDRLREFQAASEGAAEDP